jgi:hypothetical protein
VGWALPPALDCFLVGCLGAARRSSSYHLELVHPPRERALPHVGRGATAVDDAVGPLELGGSGWAYDALVRRLVGDARLLLRGCASRSWDSYRLASHLLHVYCARGVRPRYSSLMRMHAICDQCLHASRASGGCRARLHVR